MGVTRHACPSCPCNYCKKDGHIADNCTRAQRSKERSRPLSLSLKRKMKPESENARKKSTAPPTILTPNLLSIPTDSRNFHGLDASPLLDAEVRYQERLKSFRSS
jgi:hypothetical protein